MAFNGSGTFVRLFNWVVDKGNDVPITASRMDEEQDGIATGLSNCITKDGQTIVSANIPMNSKKFTGLTNGSARTDSIALGQVQDGTYTDLGTLGGAADAYTATPTPAITAYATSMSFRAKIQATNLTTTPYLAINAIGTPASDAVITKWDNAGAEIAVEIGDLLLNKIYHFDRNPGDTGWIVLDPENKASATTIIKGASYISNQVTISNGTDADHDIDFTAGNFIFSGGDGQAVVSALTKQLDASFAVGTAAGGLADALTIAIDTTYHCFALSSADGETTDFGFDTDFNAVNLLADVNVIAAGLTKYKWKMAVITDGSSNILGFTQTGKNVLYNTIITQFTATTGIPTSDTDLVLDTPNGFRCEAFLNVFVNTAPATTRVATLIDKVGGLSMAVVSVTNGGNGRQILPFSTNSASTIQHKLSGSTADNYVVDLFGWKIPDELF